MFDHFARFYDHDYRNYDDDLDGIVELALNFGGPTLELGCGTGRLLLPLAVAGCVVTGVDISPALLRVAESKLRAAGLEQHVTLVEDDLRTVDLGTDRFRFAFCTSNTLMHLTTADDQLAALCNARRHLLPGGALLIDLFNPDVPRLNQINGLQELADQWTDDRSGIQVVKWCVRTIDRAQQLQDTLFIYEESLSDGSVRRTTCPFTLRFLWRNEAELLLAQAGYRVTEVWGDFAGAPYDSGSDHLILLAENPV